MFSLQISDPRGESGGGGGSGCERVGERFHVDGDAQTRVGFVLALLWLVRRRAEHEQTHHQQVASTSDDTIILQTVMVMIHSHPSLFFLPTPTPQKSGRMAYDKSAGDLRSQPTVSLSPEHHGFSFLPFSLSLFLSFSSLPSLFFPSPSNNQSLSQSRQLLFLLELPVTRQSPVACLFVCLASSLRGLSPTRLVPLPLSVAAGSDHQHQQQTLFSIVLIAFQSARP